MDSHHVLVEEKEKRKKVEAPKSQGPKASWVIKEVSLLERGDFKDFEAVLDAIEEAQSCFTISRVTVLVTTIRPQSLSVVSSICSASRGSFTRR